MKVLVIGSGGREHAIVWAISKSPLVEQIIIAPGNPGTAQLGKNTQIAADDIEALVHFADDNHVDFVVVGPETPLAEGIVDEMAKCGIQAFGPTIQAAQLESSKAFSKAFMKKHNIPTAEYAEFDSYAEAVKFIQNFGRPVVVKADGLAAGKGVIICETPDEAIKAVQDILVDEAFGKAGSRVVIEERLIGREVSVLAFCDGKSIAMMPPSRDHKRIFDNDDGLNTGGMGAISPLHDVSGEVLAEIKTRVLQPVIDGMAARGTPYKGVLYAGMMLTSQGFMTLEFNCRFGDPETQAILPLLESDLLEIMIACTNGTLDQIDIQWKSGACATIVATSPGYPGSYPKGLPVMMNSSEDVMVFHAGTALDDTGKLVTAGGRVLAVSAIGIDLDTALREAYSGMKNINFEGMHYRHDIGRT